MENLDIEQGDDTGRRRAITKFEYYRANWLSGRPDMENLDIEQGDDTERVREVTNIDQLCTHWLSGRPDMESPGIVDQTIPGCPRKERDKKMKRRLKMFFSCPHYSTGISGLQGAFLLKKYEAGRKAERKTMQIAQVSAAGNIEIADVRTVAHISDS